MRTVFSPAIGDRGEDLLRIVGDCRKCGKRNIVWIVRGHVITMSTIPCEHCGSYENEKKNRPDQGIRWRPGTSCWSGRVMGKNLPELARDGDLVI